MESVGVTLIGSGAQVSEPWLWRLCRDYQIEVNVVKANIDADSAWVQARLTGPNEEIQRAIAWLMTTGLHVEADRRAVGA